MNSQQALYQTHLLHRHDAQNIGLRLLYLDVLDWLSNDPRTTNATGYICTGVIIVRGVVPITVCRILSVGAIVEERRDRDNLDIVSEE